MKLNSLLLMFALLIITGGYSQVNDAIIWTDSVVINNTPPVTDTVNGTILVSRSEKMHRNYGSQYPRLLQLADGNWLAGYTISRNKGYQHDAKGGFEIEIAKSTDNGRHWQPIAILTDEGRDLDNTQMIECKDGSILLACRSVRWQESYRLPVYKSNDKGKTWRLLSTIDENEGKPGELGKPDKGIYEPHFYFLNDGRLSVMYANEKHVTESKPYSQVISQKISADNGKTWGEEIWVAYDSSSASSRPGMPVWTKMKNDKFIVVYEICGPEKCNIYYKISDDGINWPYGHGTQIPGQLGGPYVLSLSNGMLVVSSNQSNISVSKDFGKTWQTNASAWDKTLWVSMYELQPGIPVVVNSVFRTTGGNNIQMRVGKIR